MIMTSGATNNDMSSSSNSAPCGSLLPDSTPQSAREDTQIKMSAATVSEEASTISLSLDNDLEITTITITFDQGEEPLEIKTLALNTRGRIRPRLTWGHDADDEADETRYESEGEDDDNNNNDDMNGARTKPAVDTSFLESSLHRRINSSSRAVFETNLAEDGNNFDPTIVSPVIPSPVFHLQGKPHDSVRTLNRSFAQ
ncbi:MAG: hypothetical protein BYD32DRAFT_466345 [Podila humilis]|nr:MAG: hypothetical protein BYD32DRAFT_466345 [Podila humilis]